MGRCAHRNGHCNRCDMAHSLDIILIAEGVETVGEARWLFKAGIDLQQGDFFARPALDALAENLEERLSAVLDVSPLSSESLDDADP